MPRLFVILCQGRSGSTLLGELLSSCPEISAAGEILAEPGRAGWPAQRSRLERFVGSSAAPAARAAGFKATGFKATGFKAKLSDVLDAESFGSLLREKGFHLVLLRRRNLVKQALSWIYADRLFERHGVWNVDRDGIEFEPLSIDGDDLLRRIEALERGREALRRFVGACGLATTALDYEDLREPARDEAGRVARALGVTPSGPLEAKVRKHTPDRLADAVANPAELFARLAAAGYLQQL
jgi:LPS sulfotransferase NodH